MTNSQRTDALSKRPVVVLGMFRSGTSCVASCLSKLGFHLGDEDALFPPDAYNPGGYYEIKDLMRLNWRILASFGMQHFRIEEIPEDWVEFPGMGTLIGEASNILKGMSAGKERWGWKEPQTSVLMPLYRHMIQANGWDPVYVICVRNPLDVCASQRSHSPLPHIGERVVGLWLHYTLSALRETKGAKRIVIPYDRFVSEPRPYLGRLADLIDPRLFSDAELESAVGQVRSDWRHNRQPESGLAEWPELVGDTFSLAQDCANAPIAFQNGEFDSQVDTLWVRWRRLRDMVRTTAIPTGRFVMTWTENGMSRSDEAPMIPTGHWQTISIPIKAPPSSLVHIDPYQTPCLFWIRRAVLRGGPQEFSAELRPGRTGMLSPVEGNRRLVVWGPDPLILALPNVKVEELEMDVLVQSHPNALNEVISVLRSNLEFVVKKLNQASR